MSIKQVVVVNDETTIQLFLEAAQLKLGVPLAKRVFIEGGGEINNIMDLAQDDVCYISGGENYVSPAVEYGNAEEPGLGGYTSQTRCVRVLPLTRQAMIWTWWCRTSCIISLRMKCFVTEHVSQ